MNYSNAVQQAKAERSDHRKARAVAGSVARRTRKRDSKDFVTVEREHDPLGRFGGNLKAVYFDSDGDGKKDSYGRVYRGGAANKPGVIIPTFGPPKTGPSGLLAEEIFIPIPASGPSGLTLSVIAPAAGPSGLETSVIAPAAGPSDLETSVIAPASGPSDLDTEILAPTSGPSDIVVSEYIPAAPQSGPSGLSVAVVAPAAGPSDLDASVASPASGPSDLEASVLAPQSGPSGLSTEFTTLNIDIVSDQTFADDPNSGTEGEIKYSSDVEHLFIHDGTVWHRTNGGNS